MYANALEFLEEERDAWRPFEALADVPDDRLDVPVPEAHGWSARDLMSHLAAWQAYALSTAKELAVGEKSPTKERLDREWDERGDAMNLDIQVEWRALPSEQVRERFRTIAGELRGYLTVVPETRWLKNSDYLRYFTDETLDHYADHTGDLEAILEASRR
jgi:Mycothiol maleylpyruvate isomerase N-terminal domain